MKKLVSLALGVLSLTALSTPVVAQDHSFRIFLTADWISPLSTTDVTLGSVTDSVEAANALGYEAGFEWRANKLLGIEASYLAGTTDVDFGSTKIGELDQTAITAAVNFHVLPTKVFDLWVAPIVSWYDFKDFELSSSVGGGTATVDSEWGYGAAVGFDIGFGKTFAITGGVRWVDLSVGDSGDKVGIDPLIARLGIAFRLGSR